MRRATRATPWALLTTIGLAFWGPTPSYAQDAEKKSQEERIQQLEAQVADLQAEPKVSGEDAEDKEAAEKAAEQVRGMTPEQRKQYHQGIAAGQPANYNAAWHIGTPKRDVVDKGWMGLKNTPSEIRLSGWV